MSVGAVSSFSCPVKLMVPATAQRCSAGLRRRGRRRSCSPSRRCGRPGEAVPADDNSPGQLAPDDLVSWSAGVPSPCHSEVHARRARSPADRAASSEDSSMSFTEGTLPSYPQPHRAHTHADGSMLGGSARPHLLSGEGGGDLGVVGGERRLPGVLEAVAGQARVVDLRRAAVRHRPAALRPPAGRHHQGAPEPRHAHPPPPP